MKDKAIFDEVNEKINRIKQKFTVKMDWGEDSRQNDGEIINVYTDSWQDADNVADGAKIKAIEEIIPNTPSNSVIFYAPKGAVIDSHSHPQMEFCICLSGKVRFITIENEHYLLEPIESIYVKPDELHSVEFLEESQIIVSWFPKLEF
jgi:quercetin dioxygenase-like cupin family protein